MRKDEFLRKLEMLLSDISAEEREEAMAFYRSYFEEAGVEKEADILAELSSPESVAEIIKRDLGMIVAMEQSRGRYEDADAYHKDSQAQQNTDTYYKWTGDSTDNVYGNYEDSQQNRQEQEKRNKTIIVLVIIIGILTSPAWLGILTGIIGTVIGISASLVGITFAMFVVGAVFIGLGIVMLAGLGEALVAIPAGLAFVGAGLMTLALAVLLLLACVALFGKFFPWACKGIYHLCKRPFAKKEAQTI